MEELTAPFAAAMFDFDAERHALATFMTDEPTRRRMVAELAGPDAFTDPICGRLWPVLSEMHDGGKGIDPAKVRREVKRRSIDVPDDEFASILSRHGGDPYAAIERVKSCRRRRWLWTEMGNARKALELAESDEVSVASTILDRFGEMIRRATRPADRGGGAAELAKRFSDIDEGKIANLDWPYAPTLTHAARPLESGSITMLSGAPGDGKTFWLLQSLAGWIEQGSRPSVCMLEKPRPWHLARCLAMLEGNAKLLESKWVMENKAKREEAVERHHAKIERLGECISEGRRVGDTLEDISRWIDAEADDHDVVLVDPISLADASEKRWVADSAFIRSCIRTCERTNVRIVLVTHPNSSRQGPASLASLMGGATYQRATDSVLHVTKLDKPKKFDVANLLAGTLVNRRVTCNRTVSVFKGRNGSAGGKRFAYDFGHGLAFAEQGIITGEADEEHDDGSDDEPPFHQ